MDSIKPTDLCICGHEDQYHDGGFGGIYCDGNGNHRDSFGGKSHTPNLCPCERFEPVKKELNTACNYRELWDMACEQISQACELLGIDTTEEMADGWTLLERCKEIKSMGVVPLKLDCPKCHSTRAWTYPCTVVAGAEDPRFVRCASCGHLWSNKEVDKKIVLTDENGNENN